jgi:MFS transporter, AAHS family, 4-hydroxybenzoate transporter
MMSGNSSGENRPDHMSSREVTIQKAFDSIPRTSPYQIWICFLCFLITFLDGFDLTIIGVAVPKIAEFLHAKPDALGLAMSAGQFGPLIGAIILGMAADRFGRKWMLFGSALVFGLFTLVTVWITNVEQLAILRFIAGIGLGGAVPNALAFGSEYAPSRSRKTFIATIYAGMAVGSTAGGLVAAYFLPRFGWQSLFLFGGAIPLLIATVAALLLPESLEFLAAKGDKEERIRKIFSKIAPAVLNDPDCRFIPTVQKSAGVPIKRLFMEGRALTTTIIFLAVIGGLYSLYVLVSWAPTLLQKSGASVVQYSLAFACLNFGAAVAFIIVGRLMDKGNSYLILKSGFVIGFVSLVVFGLLSGGSFITVAVMSIVCGFFINGSFCGLLTLATIYYPADIRGTAVGWVYAVAKVGALLAPAVGGFLLSQGWSVARICSTNAFVSLFVAFLVLMLQWRASSAAASEFR